MTKFNKSDENEQFVSILVKDGTNTGKLFNHICKQHPTAKAHLQGMDENEILLELPDSGCSHYDFSLNELRNTTLKMAIATITHFCVDLDEPSQRYCG